MFAGDGIPTGTLNVVYGANEAGKSTALRAVAGLLFGIPTHTTDAHQHQMSDLRVGAVLEATDGSRVELVRRKGKKNTLLDPEGNVLDEGLLRRICGHATEETFRALFGLDHESLRAGAEALLAGQGHVGESLFEAALGGGRGIHRVLQELEGEADALFTAKGHKRKLHDAIQAYTEARTEMRLRARSGEAWQTQRRALEEAKAGHERLAEGLRARKRALHRLERIRRLLPLVARRARVLERIEALGDPVLLPADAGKSREGALTERQLAASDLARLAGELAEISARRDALSVPAWLDDPAVARLIDLQDRLGAHRKAAQDRPGLLGALAAHEAELDALATRLRGGRTAHDSPRLALTGLGIAARARVRSLSLLEAALVQRGALARRALDDLELRHRAMAGELEAMPPVEDTGPLLRLLRRVEREGDLEAHLETVEKEQARLDAELERRLTSLGLDGTRASDDWSKPERLLALSPPPAESVDRFASELQTLAVREERLVEELAALHRKQRGVDRKWAELARAGEVPSLATVAQARTARADAWARLIGAGAGADADADADADPASRPAERGPHWSNRIAAFEESVLRADQAADRLLREADRVASAASLEVDRREIARLIADAGSQREDLGRRGGAANLGWKALWSGLGVKPGSADDMRAWLRRFGEASELARRLEGVSLEATRRRDQVRRARVELTSAVRDLPGLVIDPAMSLIALCERAAGAAQARETAASRRAALLRETVALAEERARATRESADAEAALAAWRSSWAEAIAPLGLASGASTAEAEAVLELTAALGRKQEESAEIKRRLQGIDRDAAQFQESVRGLVAVLTPDLAGQPEADAAEIILQRHREGMPARQTRAEIDLDLQRRRQAQRAAESAHASAEDRLGALMRAARVMDLPGLEQAERRSAESSELQHKLRESEDQLVGLADGLTLEAALRDVAGASAEDLDDQIDLLREEIEELDRDAQRANQSIGSVGAGLRLLEDPGGAAAADAAEVAQGHLARIRELAIEYARRRLGVHLLAREIERYREQHQGPVLERASALLARLTLDRYVGLRADFDDGDRPILRCIRADLSKVSVDGLSDGTRDQLYLALRLATLERQSESTGEPLPLILDDILIHFDDERAGAALAVLAAHARGTQVILFTHHARIVDLAERTISPGSLRISRLEG